MALPFEEVKQSRIVSIIFLRLVGLMGILIIVGYRGS